MCYAESTDGIHWVKPDLGLFDFAGSSANNIVLGGDRGKFPVTGKWTGDLGTDLRWRGDMVPFIDHRAGVPPEGRYMAHGKIRAELHCRVWEWTNAGN